MLGKIVEQDVEQGSRDLRGVKVARPGLRCRAGSDEDDVGIGGAVRELQAAGCPGVDGGVGIERNRRSRLGEMQPQIAAPARAPFAEAFQRSVGFAAGLIAERRFEQRLDQRNGARPDQRFRNDRGPRFGGDAAAVLGLSACSRKP